MALADPGSRPSNKPKKPFQERPVSRYIAWVAALLVGAAKFLQIVVSPGLPDWAQIALWILFGFAVLVAVVQGILRAVNRKIEREVQKQIEQKQPELPPNADLDRNEGKAETAYEATSILYGRAIEKLIAHCTIDRDGSAVFRREMHLLAHAPISKMDHYMLFPESKELPEPPEDVQVKALGPGYTLQTEAKQLTSGKRSLTMSIRPVLPPGERLRFQITETSPPDLYNVTGRAPRGREEDYFAWDIIRPTKELELLVFFPNGFEPINVWTEVWDAVGQSETMHPDENDRIRRFLKEEMEGVYYTLSLRVPYPILGLSYVIMWLPPVHPPAAGQDNTGTDPTGS